MIMIDDCDWWLWQLIMINDYDKWLWFMFMIYDYDYDLSFSAGIPIPTPASAWRQSHHIPNTTAQISATRII